MQECCFLTGIKYPPSLTCGRYSLHGRRGLAGFVKSISADSEEADPYDQFQYEYEIIHWSECLEQGGGIVRQTVYR